MLSLVLFVVLVYLGYPVTVVYDRFIQLAVAATAFSYIMAGLLYIKALNAPNHALASGGNTGKKKRKSIDFVI